MNLKLVDRITKAVLYEGYLLYPYRPSSIKNQQRFNFGVLSPPAYTLNQNGNAHADMQTECLILATSQSRLMIKVRCLHLQNRQIMACYNDLANDPALASQNIDKCDAPVTSLNVDGKLYQTWQEAVEREVLIDQLDLNQLLKSSQLIDFSFPLSVQKELLQNNKNQLMGSIIRSQQSINGSITISAQALQPQLFKVTINVANKTLLDNAQNANRDQVLAVSLISTHIVVGVQWGEFISLLEPPSIYQQWAEQCQNIGCWPVLIGEAKERDLMLSSPIILYDYPKIAPESMGDLFDSTEIDEILTLRIMTLTDDEKEQMQQIDEQARCILERTEHLSNEEMLRLHGRLHMVDHPQSPEHQRNLAHEQDLNYEKE